MNKITFQKGIKMKKYTLLCLVGLTGCTNAVCPNQYIANMYANGTLNNYEDTGASCNENKNCPGCHVKHFDRVLLTVDEVLSGYNQNGIKNVEVCAVNIQDSLKLKNISETRYVPATHEYTCEMVYEKEKNYLKAMGFSE